MALYVFRLDRYLDGRNCYMLDLFIKSTILGLNVCWVNFRSLAGR